MPFRISNTPSVFQRLLNATISHIAPNNVFVYLDDKLIAVNTGEEIIAITIQIIEALLSRKLYGKSKKCQFLRTEVTFLGFNIRKAQLSPTEDTINNVNSFNTPKSTKQVCSFLGLSNFLRTFIKGYSTLTTPLNNLLKGATDKKKKNPKRFIWTTEAKTPFYK
jgi:Reverse transcriptase (RNA-dependent DNA polymerase)